MSLNGKRLILLIVLFIGACFFISAQQSGRIISSSVDEKNALASATSAPIANDTDAKEATTEVAAGKNNTTSQAASASTKSVDQKAPAKLKSLSVNSVAKSGPDMPLNSKSSSGKGRSGVVNTSDRKHVVGVAVNEKNGRARNNLARKTAGLNQKTRKANKRRNGSRTAKRHVHSQHRALTKSNKRKRTIVQAKRRKLVVKKRVKRRRRVAYAAPKRIAERRQRRVVRTRRRHVHVRRRHIRVARATPKRVKVRSRQLKPLPAAEKWITPTEFWRMWRKKCHTGQ
jgi:hypothetical protein